MPTTTAADAPQLQQPCALPHVRCLLLDHDDTTVRGTEEVHYPAHVESVRVLRPDLQPCSLEEWFEQNHHPGVSAYLRSLFTPEQMPQEEAIWRRAMDAVVPTFYEGMPEALAAFKAAGGKVAVVSHSPAEVIRRHYESHSLAEHIAPDLILGWDSDPQRRKPSVWPALHALEQLGATPEETLVLDDLSPGVQMARKAGIAVAGAGWGHAVPTIESYMRSACDRYFRTVGEFSAFLAGGGRDPEPPRAALDSASAPVGSPWRSEAARVRAGCAAPWEGREGVLSLAKLA
eukprot:CAMPEP_0179080574 /NCGR_PEP_ID=MMETSP0796-20121207/36221_1 /TAXON_ID=73915 /ORGANISM="Pyrodinium bahamense, Strain pbaha01" /LENGTH=288 /DNA_ID=CAMNT_0020777931 /DNA_START=40 /DNA_END=907 /DNA_ORIENTATION=-